MVGAKVYLLAGPMIFAVVGAGPFGADRARSSPWRYRLWMHMSPSALSGRVMLRFCCAALRGRGGTCSTSLDPLPRWLMRRWRSTTTGPACTDIGDRLGLPARSTSLLQWMAIPVSGSTQKWLARTPESPSYEGLGRSPTTRSSPFSLSYQAPSSRSSSTGMQPTSAKWSTSDGTRNASITRACGPPPTSTSTPPLHSASCFDFSQGAGGR
mmetsp:Transcript_33691/g.96771  ORF Transcript_33691/g.96771 Transcript_33691/m.96771 type:complete len:211 (+) Transcript_33691:3243-3875(+)